MMHCPFCGHAAHARTSRSLSENVKQRYHQCRNIECSATFRTLESIEEIIQPSNRRDLSVPDIPLSPAMQKKYKDYPASALRN
ncbi:ogr/Delta-like zinc finger family protein [Pectobacterium actinidiae]|uniref:ogr/Delta-like zinc finger family protein n=1 Tax=Pectobacterium actinidiae TaxID=1507808 RepID=UPI000907B5AE|nr:ogr/Delta-like zinc finger family protein [Pectobacterium actinidiae]